MSFAMPYALAGLIPVALIALMLWRRAPMLVSALAEEPDLTAAVEAAKDALARAKSEATKSLLSAVRGARPISKQTPSSGTWTKVSSPAMEMPWMR